MFWSGFYFLGLTVAAVTACAFGGIGLRRAAAVLICNWLGCMLAVVAAESLTPWGLFLLFDAASAVAVLRQPASRTQAIIGAIFCFQMAFHVAFALIGNGAADRLYLDLLALGGWLQIATLAGGSIYGGGKRFGLAVDARRHLHRSDPPHHRSMGASG